MFAAYRHQKYESNQFHHQKNLSEMELHFPLGKDLKVIRAQHIHHVLVLALRNDILLTLIVIAIFQ